MTTDITELAQSLKAAAEKATPGRIGDRIDGSGSIKYQCFGNDGSLVLQTDHKNMEYGFIGPNSEADELFFRECAPGNILALVEALEKAQQVEEELCKLLPPGAEYMDPPDGGDVTPLEGVRRMVADYRQRIAELEDCAEAEAVGADKTAEDVLYWMKRCKELESRTVKLVDCDFGAVQHMSGGSTDYCHGFVDGTQNAIRAISAVGIKVEAE